MARSSITGRAGGAGLGSSETVERKNKERTGQGNRKRGGREMEESVKGESIAAELDGDTPGSSWPSCHVVGCR